MNAMNQLRLGVSSQSRNLWKVLFFLYLPIILFFVAIGLLSRISDNLTLALLMRDPITSAKLPVVAGLVSQVEAILWSASLTVCIFGWAMLQRRGNEFTRSRRFLLQFATITAILFLDDLFLFHGEIAPKALHIGKAIVIAVYLITIIVFLYLSWQEILSSEYLILMLALLMFGASIFLDSLPLTTFGVPQFGQQIRFFLEDGLKFAGVATWLTYFSRYAVRQIEASSGIRNI